MPVYQHIKNAVARSATAFFIYVPEGYLQIRKFDFPSLFALSWTDEAVASGAYVNSGRVPVNVPDILCGVTDGSCLLKSSYTS